MKKIIFTGSLMATMILSVGCDTNEENIEIGTWNYINTSDSVEIDTYNGFKLINSKTINNKDRSIRVILDFDKPLK